MDTRERPPSLSRILAGDFQSVAEMRLAMLATIMRFTLIVATLILVYSLAAFEAGVMSEIEWGSVLAAFIVMFVGSELLMALGLRKDISAAIYLCLLIAAISFGHSGEVSDAWDGTCAIYMAIPIVLSAAILRPWAAFVTWGLVAVAGTIMCVFYGENEWPNMFALLSLLLLASVVFVTSLWSENLLGRLSADKEVLDQAIDVVIKCERSVVSQYDIFDPQSS
jgi:hypothetical protein